MTNIKTYKPSLNLEISAIQWTGFNTDEIIDFCGRDRAAISYKEYPELCFIRISTLGGSVKMRCNDYVVKTINGNLYPVRKEEFEYAYKEVTENG